MIRIYFVLNFIKYIPKIGFRFLKLLFKRKKLSCKKFSSGNYYCIEGTLNQLIWKVENAVFITLSNSYKIFFDSGELIFHVNKAKNQFQLTAYGIHNTHKLRTQIRIAVLNKNDLNNIITKSKNIVINNSNVVQQPNISIQLIENNSISFQKSLKPKLPKKSEIRFPQSQFLNKYSAAIFNTNSIKELQKLKQVIDKNEELA